MNWVPSWAWFAHLGWARSQRHSLRDFADMGTAFGLDASLEFLPCAEPAMAKKNGRPEIRAPQQRPSRFALRKGR